MDNTWFASGEPDASERTGFFNTASKQSRGTSSSSTNVRSYVCERIPGWLSTIVNHSKTKLPLKEDQIFDPNNSKNRTFIVFPLIKKKDKNKINKKHSQTADSSTSVTLTYGLDHTSRSRKFMFLDVVYCIVT